MTLRLTNSEKQDFMRCRRMWWVKYYLRLTPRRERYETSSYLGTIVHDALAHYYDPAVDIKDPVAYLNNNEAKALEERPDAHEYIGKQHKLARTMISGYLEWVYEEGADLDLQIEGSESMAEAKLTDGVTLLSKLDAPVTRMSDGLKLALEHKTVDTIESRLSGAQIDSQFLTEHLVRFMMALEQGASAEEANAQCQGVLLNLLRKSLRTARATPPFYHREAVTHNINELRHHWRHVMYVAGQIEGVRRLLDAGADHHIVVPPNPMPHDCSWRCDLFRICALADDGSDFEGALNGMFEEHDPLERYEGAKPL